MASVATGTRWCFTLNNYTPEELYQCSHWFDGGLMKYMVYGHEVGDKGTCHLQGFFILRSNSRFAGVKKLNSRMHLELAKGTSEQAADYCKKDGDFYEWGALPMPPKAKGLMEQERWEGAFQSAKEGDFMACPPDIRLRYWSALKHIHKDFMQKPADLAGVCGEWYYGQAGSGKTTFARDNNPGAYIKSRDRWWCGYQGEDVVILDDLDKYHVALGGLLKDWGDKWTFKAETKGGYLWLRPSKFIVTSQ